MRKEWPHCWRLARQTADRPAPRTAPATGRRSPINTAIIPMATSSSRREKPRDLFRHMIVLPVRGPRARGPTLRVHPSGKTPPTDRLPIHFATFLFGAGVPGPGLLPVNDGGIVFAPVILVLFH